MTAQLHAFGEGWRAGGNLLCGADLAIAGGLSAVAVVLVRILRGTAAANRLGLGLASFAVACAVTLALGGPPALLFATAAVAIAVVLVLLPGMPWTRAVRGCFPGPGRAGRPVQTALADADREVRRFADAMPYPVFTAQADGTIDYANDAWLEATGLSLASHNEGTWREALHPDDLASFAAQREAAFANGESYEVVFRIRRQPDAAYRWFVSRGTPVRDDSGAIVRWVGLAADVTDVKLASDTRRVLDTLGQIVVIETADGAIDYASPTWTTFAGTDAGGDWRGRVHPDDLQRTLAHLRASRKEPCTVHHCELRLRAADGSHRWFLARTVMLADNVRSLRQISSLTDIDDFRRAQAAVDDSEMRYRALTEALPQLVWIVDERDRIVFANEHWSAYTGLLPEADATRDFQTLIHPDDLETFGAYRAQRAERPHAQCELRLARRDGCFRWHLVRRAALAEHGAQPRRWIVTATDIEDRKMAEAALATSAAELSRRAMRDALTDLPNRSALLERITGLLAEAANDGTQLAVLFVDIDDFGAVNDSLGNAAGDEVLKETAAKICSVSREADLAGRVGGDEFVVVYPCVDAAEAPAIAERVAAAVRHPIELHQKTTYLKSSVGISIFPDDGTTAAELIGRAEAAMRLARANGGDGWSLSPATALEGPAIPRLELEAELREAIADHQFRVYYQPIVKLQTGRIVGAEALVRWAHPSRGLLGPGEFVPFAERHGLIAAIGEIVIASACDYLCRLSLSAGTEFSIAVNVSARQFSKPGFISNVASALESRGLDARRLEIEITESTVMNDREAVVAMLHQLASLGVRLSIDDFGTGYSSLAYLKNFPIDTLKIDRSFVTDIAANFTDRAIAKTIVTLAHNLGLRVIAEGVETIEQRDFLLRLGADDMQGYLISRPLSPDEFQSFLSAQAPLPALEAPQA